jgi:hypothetical protein
MVCLLAVGLPKCLCQGDGGGFRRSKCDGWRAAIDVAQGWRRWHLPRRHGDATIFCGVVVMLSRGKGG